MPLFLVLYLTTRHRGFIGHCQSLWGDGYLSKECLVFTDGAVEWLGKKNTASLALSCSPAKDVLLKTDIGTTAQHPYWEARQCLLEPVGRRYRGGRGELERTVVVHKKLTGKCRKGLLIRSTVLESWDNFTGKVKLINRYAEDTSPCSSLSPFWIGPGQGFFREWKLTWTELVRWDHGPYGKIRWERTGRSPCHENIFIK